MVAVIRTIRRYNISNYGFRILFKLSDKDTDEPKDITGYVATFNMWIPGKSSYYLSGTCSVYDADHGECTYLVKRGDFSDVGTYHAQIELKKSGYVEDSELFEVVLMGVPQACPPSYDYDSLGVEMDITPSSQTYMMPVYIDGDITLGIDNNSDVNIEYGEVGNIPIELVVSGETIYDELYENVYSVLLGGTNQYLRAPNSSNWYFEDNNFTVDMRVKFTSLTGLHTIIAQWDSGSNKSWMLRHDTSNNRMIFSYSTTGADEYNAYFNWTPSTATWYDIMIQRNGANLELNIDGSQQGSTFNIGTASLYNASTDLLIGKNDGLGEHLSGNVDEMSIWKYIAIPTADLYNGGVPGDLKLLSDYDDNCFAWWRMGDDDTFPILINKKETVTNATMINCVAGDIVADIP